MTATGRSLRSNLSSTKKGASRRPSRLLGLAAGGSTYVDDTGVPPAAFFQETTVPSLATI